VASTQNTGNVLKMDQAAQKQSAQGSGLPTNRTNLLPACLVIVPVTAILSIFGYQVNSQVI
jgi:hypothetical protein